jgi:hypothetical protein
MASPAALEREFDCTDSRGHMGEDFVYKPHNFGIEVRVQWVCTQNSQNMYTVKTKAAFQCRQRRSYKCYREPLSLHVRRNGRKDNAPVQ